MRPLWLSLLTLCLAATALAGPKEDLAKIKVGLSQAEARQVLDSTADYLDPNADDAQAVIGNGNGKVTEDMVERLAPILAAADAKHAEPVSKVSNPQVVAQTYLVQNGYKDIEKVQAKNWAAHGWDRFFKWLGDFFNSLVPKANPQAGEIPGFMGGVWLTYLMWGVIVVAVGFLLYFAITKLSWTSFSRTKKAKGLAEDEPDRTADEWLTRADELAAQGKYREAVRSLYVASLIRIDEANIARFRKGETNWEHLHRIEASPRKPAALDFRPPTMRFDIVWYGHMDEGIEDYTRFVDWYRETLNVIGRMAA